MMLPQPPLSLSPTAREYLEALVYEVERELQLRPARQKVDGVLYLTQDIPVRLISPNGTLYELSVDDGGSLVTTLVTP